MLQSAAACKASGPKTPKDSWGRGGAGGKLSLRLHGNVFDAYLQLLQNSAEQCFIVEDISMPAGAQGN